MKKSQNKQIHALELSIDALKEKRRREFSAGEFAYRQGIRVDVLKSGGVTGTLFGFSESGHEKYVEYTEAIQQLEDLIEIITDPGVVHA